MDLTKRLPPEILSHIFILIQAHNPILRPAAPPHSPQDTWSPKVPTSGVNYNQSGRSHLLMRFQNRRALAWVRLITHVCARWRSIALSSHALWARPTIYLGLTWFEEMMRRSGKALLSLSARECGLYSGFDCARTYMTEVFLQITEMHARRIRSLKFEASHGLPFLLQSHQALEEFEIKSAALDFHKWGIPSGAVELFSGHAPCLRSLSITFPALSYRRLPGQSAIWNNLQHIHLSLLGPLLDAGSNSPLLLALSHARALRTCTLEASCENPHQDAALECDTSRG